MTIPYPLLYNTYYETFKSAHEIKTDLRDIRVLND